jgi:hypothetical protein
VLDGIVWLIELTYTYCLMEDEYPQKHIKLDSSTLSSRGTGHAPGSRSGNFVPIHGMGTWWDAGNVTRLRGCHDREQVTGEEAEMESKASREKPPSLFPSLLVSARAREAERRPTCGCEGSERKRSRDRETLECPGRTGVAACERL